MHTLLDTALVMYGMEETREMGIIMCQDPPTRYQSAITIEHHLQYCRCECTVFSICRAQEGSCQPPSTRILEIVSSSTISAASNIYGSRGCTTTPIIVPCREMSLHILLQSKYRFDLDSRTTSVIISGLISNDEFTIEMLMRRLVNTRQAWYGTYIERRDELEYARVCH